MKFLKRFLSVFFEPIRLTGNRDFSERLAKFFTHHSVVIYFLAAIITLIIFIINYI